MFSPRLSSLSLLAGVLLIAGCAAHKPAAVTETAAPAAVAPAPVNDYPTLTRVEYVLECMQEQGGQNLNTLYHCSCAIDKIAASLPHEEFQQAQTFTKNLNTPGERGAEFRDPPQSSKLRTQLKDLKAKVAEACFLKPTGPARK